MQLFYHVTRDIELPRAGRAVGRSALSRVCEACGQKLQGDDDSLSGAGLRFCNGCRDRMEKSAIQIHFCDRCRISLPAGLVQRGTAISRDGRIICPACLTAETSARRTRRVAALLLILLSAAAGTFLAVLG